MIHKIKKEPGAIKIVSQRNLTETRDPTTLTVSKGNVLYCELKDRHLTARFTRQAYLDLSKEVIFDRKTRRYCLNLAGKRHPIQGVR